MPELMHVLIVEDLPTDAELTEREVRKVLGDCQFKRVETHQEYIAALAAFRPELIISDFKLPSFDGLSALKIALERCPEVPFIIVTGSMNEDTAVDCMKAGAWDYVIKEHVKRLGSAIEGALERQRLWAIRKGTEESIREHRATLNAILDSADFPIFSVNRGFRYTGFNRAHALMMKAVYGADVRVGASLKEYQVPPEDWQADTKSLDRALGGESVFTAVTSGDEGPSRRHFEVTHNPVCTDTGDIIGVSVFARDVTQRKRMEAEREQLQQQLRMSQKMDAIGSLAAGIAHDFNNLLSVILSYTGLALDDGSDGANLRESLLEIKKAAGRAVTLTRQLLAFSRKQVLRPVTLNLNETASGVEKMLQRLLREDIQLDLALAPDLGMAFADAGQIEQVLMNLVVNARDAMPNGGKLTIETSNVYIDEDEAGRQVGVLFGHYVQVLVKDTGHGMDEATRARIFEPFFTTKDKDKGTGLGLSTVHGIVRQSNGNIWVESQPGYGTTFRICLPRDFTGTVSRSNPPMSIRQRTGNETILVVDDDETVRRVVCKTLERIGYRVLCAEGRDDAIQTVARHAGEVHLLLTDVVMPHMSGVVLAEELVKRRPNLKILYMSGHTENAVVRGGVVEAQIQFISKPFTTGELSGKVRRVLDSGVRSHVSEQEQAGGAETTTHAESLSYSAIPVLPAELLGRLLNAVVRARHDEVIELIETIRTRNPELAEGLRQKAENFEYEALRDILGH